MKFTDIHQYGKNYDYLQRTLTKVALTVAYSYRLKLDVRNNNKYSTLLFSKLNFKEKMVNTEGMTIDGYNGLYNTIVRTGMFKFTMNDVSGWMECSLEEQPAGANRYSADREFSFIFYFNSADNRTKFKAFLQDFYANYEFIRNGVRLYTDNYSSWIPSDTPVPIREMKSIFLPDEVMEKITHSIDKYLSSEAEYKEKQIPRHYGLCLYGPPGTGKSSLIMALAHKYDRDIYYPDITTLEKGGELAELFANINPNALLVLEDFDTLSAVKSRNKAKTETIGSEDKKHLLSKFLNILDGIMTPHDLMFVITSNHYDDLDDAIKRPGRLNLAVEMPYLNQEVFNQITHYFYGNDVTFNFKVEGEEIPAAVVTNIFASFFGEPDRGIEELTKYLAANK